MRLCLQNINDGTANAANGDRSTLMALAALVILLHSGLAFWLWQAAVKLPKPKEMIIEMSMVSKLPLKPQPTAKANANTVPPTSQVAKQPPLQKTIKANTDSKLGLKKIARPKPKPVVKDTLPAPVMPVPLNPPLAMPQPVPTQPINPSPSKTDAPPPANPAKANLASVSPVASDNSAATKAVAGNPVACVACPQPHYPPAARRRNMQGKVQLKLEVSAEGRVVNVTVLQSSGHNVLDEAAVADVREWQFAPGPSGITRTATQLISFRM